MSTFEEIKQRALAEWEALQNSDKPRILVGAATCGRASGAIALIETIKAELARRNIDAIVTQVGCIGMCFAEPLVDIIQPGRPRISYGNMTPELVTQLIEDYLVNDNYRPDLALGTIGEGEIVDLPKLSDMPVMKSQVRVVLGNCGHIDPENIDHYIANGGFSGLVRALGMTPEEVIEEVKKSGLRGRGGAGFPTGVKWELCRREPGKEKYLICNADEGDPGAFMDRSVLEGDPYAMLEGMLIGAYAIGATEGYIYCRAEYPLAIERLDIAIKRMEEYGLIGDNILGSDLSFHFKIKEGAGAFVCGEETALMASIEGKRGMPRSRPPFPAQSGVWAKPSNINNVETFANIPTILRRGGDWYASYGIDKSKGTKTFALAGKVMNTGLIEVPLGIPLREIIYEIGGGIRDGKMFKAAQAGGPSGGCIPAELIDLQVDYEHLSEAGAIIGSGGLVVMDEDTCMVDVARYFLSFTQSESCGKCVPCRVGTRMMLDILERITNGEGKPGDIEHLSEVAQTVRSASLCGLGQTAPNSVLSTLRYFKNEYEEHVYKKRCRAVVCKGVIIAPCRHTCPAGIDVPRYVRFIGQGKFNEALAVIREKIPFPSVCGYACFHPCETKCRRGLVDEPIAIRILKRFVADRDDGLWRQEAKTAAPTGKRVAIVGSGPAGLTAAYYLARLGHSVTVFEALPVAGGMMRVGIPAYRLPKDILENEIKEIEKLGVEIKTNAKVESVDQLLSQGYNAVFLAVGAHGGVKMGIEGEDSEGVMDCVTFLRGVSLGQPPKLGQRVAVVGGGNAAIDAARTSLRLGAKEVTMLYRRTRAEMPADPEEVEDAIDEGVKVEFLAAPTKIMRNNGTLKMECLRMELGPVDSSGRRRPVPIKGSEYTVEADTIIAAIGQTSEIPAQFGIPATKKGTLEADPDMLTTSRPGVFAGGDVVRGPASVIEAIAHGRQAAESIDKYLGGKGNIEETLAPPQEVKLPRAADEGEAGRPLMSYLPEEKRVSSFDAVELGYTPEQAIEEAARCLWCDLEES